MKKSLDNFAKIKSAKIDPEKRINLFRRERQHQKFSLILLSLFLINSVSAYGHNSIQSLLDSLDPSTAILGSIFLISFILLNFSLSRVFKNQKGIPGVISFIISFLLIYGINRSGFDYQNIYYNLFYNIGLSSTIASTFLPLIILAAAVFIVWKFNFAILFIILGIFIALYGAAFAYATGATIIIGGIFIGIGIWLLKKQRPQRNRNAGAGI